LPSASTPGRADASTGNVQAGAPSPDDAATPSPSTVVMTPVPASTRRTRWLPVSAMNRSPLGASAIAVGAYSSAAVAARPSPK
jgi:hypothetical protein